MTKKPESTGLLKWARRIGLGMLVLVGLVLGLLVVGSLYLASPAGGERLRTVALQKVNQAILGKFEAKRVLFGWNHLHLEGVTVRDPEGEPVIRLQSLDLQLVFLALVQRTLHVQRLRLTGPWVYLREDDRGLNLARAFEPAEPSAPSEPAPGTSSPLRFQIKVDDLEIVDGAFLFEQRHGGEHRELELDRLNARISGRYQHPSHHASIELVADGELLKPEKGPVKLSVQGAFDGRSGKADALIHAAGMILEASGQMTGPSALVLKLKRLEIPPALARALIPSYPLQARVALEGEGALHGETAAAKLQIRAGSARLELDGSANVAKHRLDGLTVRARNVRLQELIAKGPRSNLTLDLHAEGSGTAISNARGKVEVDLPVSEWGSQRVGPIQLRAKAEHGNFEVTELLAVIPGAKLVASGRGTQERISAQGTLTAADLSETSRAIGALLGTRAPLLMGAGNLDISARGAFRRLSVSAVGHFPKLSYEGFRAGDLEISAAVPDLQRPLESQASVTATTLQIGNKLFKDLSAQLTTAGRDLDFQVRTSGFADLALHATGRVDADHQGILLSFLTLNYPEAGWTLQKPSKLRFSGEKTAVEDLWLRSEGQSIRLDGALEGKKVRASLEIAQLDLSQLPTAFFDPSLKLKGSLSAQISARGRLPHPDVVAHVDLQKGQFTDFNELSLLLEGKYEQDRAVGKLSASALGALLSADFDFYLQGVLRRNRKPLHLALQLQQADLSRILHVVGRSDPLSGTVASRVDLSGTGEDPLLEMTLTGSAIRYDQVPPLDFTLSTHIAERGAMTANLDWQIEGSKSNLRVRAPLTLARIANRLPTRAELVKLPLEVDLEVHEFPVALIYQAGLVPTEIQGKLSVTLEARGTAIAPHGKANVVLVGGAFGNFPAADFTLLTTASPQGVDSSLNIQREGQPLLEAVASVKGPLAKLGDLNAANGFPVSLKLTAGPIRLEELRALSGPSDQPLAPPLRGVLRADLALTGSLQDPQIRFRSQLEQLTAGSQAVGAASLDSTYAKGDCSVSLVLTSSAGGQVQIQGGTKLDLSLPSIQKGLAVRAAPLHATLRAKEFDLAFLSGVVPDLRLISGRLSADANLAGTIGVPSLEGNLEWSNGRLAVLGYGEYRQIHLLMNGNTQRIDIKELTASAGSGSLRLTAQASRTGNRLELGGAADLTKFPIISDDQLVATVSMRAQVEGEISPDVVNVRRVSVPRAQIELPESSPKNLQKLSRPDDIIVLKHGQPLEKQLAHGAPGKAGFGGTGGAPTQKAREITIAIDAPRNIWVKGSDLNVELGVAEGFHISIAQQTSIFGDVRLLRGRVDVLGRRFDVQKDSDVRFAGPPTLPYLNVTALYNNEHEQVKVYITVRGQGKDFTINPSSEPPLSESEIYTLIATGRRNLKQGTGATSTSGQATSVIGSVAASELKKSLSSKLPLDVLSIEAGEQGGLTGSKLEAGRYFGDKVYIGYTGRYGADPSRGENSNAVRFEYQFTPHWELDAEYGDAKAGTADLVWTKDY